MPFDSRHDPIVRRFTLRCTRAEAFDAFVRHIGDWWPPAFTGSGEKLDTIVVGTEAGASVYEQSIGGNRFQWGEITTWAPPDQYAQTWTLGVTSPTHVAVSFADRGDGAEVTLVHDGWESDAADRAKFDDAHGWTEVLEAFAAYAAEATLNGEPQKRLRAPQSRGSQSNVCPAASYSPTPWRVQYHRRWQA